MSNDLDSKNLPSIAIRSRPATLFVVTLSVAAIGAAFLYSGSTALAQTDMATPVAAQTVTSVIVQGRQWPRVVEANGSIAAWQEASIGTVPPCQYDLLHLPPRDQ